MSLNGYYRPPNNCRSNTFNVSYTKHTKCITCKIDIYHKILVTNPHSQSPTNESRLPSPKIIQPSLLSSLDMCNIAFVVLQAHCHHVTHCFRNVNPWWSIILILSSDTCLNPGPSVRNFKDCLLNARPLHNTASAFGDFVSSNDLDMVGVTETWLRQLDTKSLIDKITPAGFHLHHVPRRNTKVLRVAVFVRNDIDSVLCQTDQRDTFEHTTVKLSEQQSSQLLMHENE